MDDGRWTEARAVLGHLQPEPLEYVGGRGDVPYWRLYVSYIGGLRSRFEFLSIWGRFPAKLGPGTVANGSGSKNAS